MSLYARGETYIPRVHELRKERLQRAPVSPYESYLWQLAIAAPYGGIIIGREDAPYLIRAYILPENASSTLAPAAYLHYFVRGDSDPNPHNHPRDTGSSLILTGGYKERRLTNDQGRYEVRIFVPGMHNQIQHDTYHKVELITPNEGCWTLFTAGPRRGPSDGTDWGFFDMETKRHIPWKQYGSTADQDPT